MNLIYRDLRKWKYQVAQDYYHKTKILGYDIDIRFLKLSPDGMLLIREGYLSDGPSGPTLDTPDTIRGAFTHDAGYELMRRGLLPESFRPYFDELLHDILLADGVPPVRAQVWRDMVGKFAMGAAKTGTEMDRTYCAGRE